MQTPSRAPGTCIHFQAPLLCLHDAAIRQYPLLPEPSLEVLIAQQFPFECCFLLNWTLKVPYPISIFCEPLLVLPFAVSCPFLWASKVRYLCLSYCLPHLRSLWSVCLTSVWLPGRQRALHSSVQWRNDWLNQHMYLLFGILPLSGILRCEGTTRVFVEFMSWLSHTYPWGLCWDLSLPFQESPSYCSHSWDLMAALEEFGFSWLSKRQCGRAIEVLILRPPAWVSVPALPLLCWWGHVYYGQGIFHFVLWFPPSPLRQQGALYYLSRWVLVKKRKAVILVKHIARCLAHSKHSVNKSELPVWGPGRFSLASRSGLMSWPHLG